MYDIREGIFKPYLYKAKAYKRNDTATIEVDRIELNRLILEGENRSYDELPSAKQDLAFTVLEESFGTGIRRIREAYQNSDAKPGD